MSLRRGFIHWARLDKRRPVLILSPDYRNAWASDVIAVPCSTVRRAGPYHLMLRRGEAGLPEPSILKCEAVITLPKERVDPTALGGPLGVERMDEVERCLFLAMGVTRQSLARHWRFFSEAGDLS